MIVVDSHEDVAVTALMYGRTYTRSVAETRAAEVGTAVPSRNGEAMLGWPDWIEGEVAVVFATVTASPVRHKIGDWDKISYSSIDEAHARYLEQLAYYEALVAENPDKFTFVRTTADLRSVLDAWDAPDTGRRRVGLLFLMEGADGIREPDEVPWWHGAGVRIVGPAWAGTQYCGGSGEPGPFTPRGRLLLQRMAEVGMVLDISHLSPEAATEALDTFEGRVMASHSNALALLPNVVEYTSDRHLRDRDIRGIFERDGVIGVVPFNAFLDPTWTRALGRSQVTVDDLIAQIDHMCEIAGDARHVGIGTDFDGGFGLDSVPIGIDGIRDMQAIGGALSKRGYTDDDVARVLGGNWLRFLGESLPS